MYRLRCSDDSGVTGCLQARRRFAGRDRWAPARPGAVQLSAYLALACGVLAPLEAKLRICDPYHSMTQSRCLLTTRGKALLPER